MIGPGEIVFTRIPWGASACESPFEWTISAALIALYEVGPMKVSTAAVLLTKRTLPFSDSLSAGVAVSTQRMAPKRSTSKFARQAFSSVPFPPVGLLTRMSSPPSASTAEVDEALQRISIGDVDRFCNDLGAARLEVLLCLLYALLRASADRDVSSLVREQARDGSANAAAPSRHDRFQSLQTKVHSDSSSSFLWSLSLRPSERGFVYLIRMAHDSIMSNRWTQERGPYSARRMRPIGDIFSVRPDPFRTMKGSPKRAKIGARAGPIWHYAALRGTRSTPTCSGGGVVPSLPKGCAFLGLGPDLHRVQGAVATWVKTGENPAAARRAGGKRGGMQGPCGCARDTPF